MPTIKQDMPPPGGYKCLDYSRIPAKSLMGSKTLIACHLAVSAAALYLYTRSYKQTEREKLERRSAMLALTPMLLAEQDREYLKQLRRNREEEAKLMANVDGWVVGTYKGEPIYKTLPPDTFVKPDVNEYYVHASPKDRKARTQLMFWQ